MEKSRGKLQRSRQRDAVGARGTSGGVRLWQREMLQSSLPAVEFKVMVIGCRKAMGLGWNQVQACPPPFAMHTGQAPKPEGWSVSSSVSEDDAFLVEMLLEVRALLHVKALTQDLAHEDAQEVVAGPSGLPSGLSNPGAGRPRWWAARHGEMQWTVGPGGRGQVRDGM